MVGAGTIVSLRPLRKTNSILFSKDFVNEL